MGENYGNICRCATIESVMMHGISRVPLTCTENRVMRHNLSEVTELMRDRRSISPERFSSRKVHKEVVELLLTNATWAPTHGMTQPWRFAAYVGDGMSTIGPKLAEWYQVAAGENASEAKVAKLEARGKQVTAMVIVGVQPDPNGRIDIRDERNAVACAMQNMYLTCTAHGLGGFWSTPPMIHLPEVQEFAGFDSDTEVIGFFYVGYPEGEWPKSHRKPLEYVTRWVDSSES